MGFKGTVSRDFLLHVFVHIWAPSVVPVLNHSFLWGHRQPVLSAHPVPEFIDPCFRENKPKTLVFSHRKPAFWACFRKNCVYNFGHSTLTGVFVPGTGFQPSNTKKWFRIAQRYLSTLKWGEVPCKLNSLHLPPKYHNLFVKLGSKRELEKKEFVATGL